MAALAEMVDMAQFAYQRTLGALGTGDALDTLTQADTRVMFNTFREYFGVDDSENGESETPGSDSGDSMSENQEVMGVLSAKSKALKLIGKYLFYKRRHKN